MKKTTSERVKCTHKEVVYMTERIINNIILAMSRSLGSEQLKKLKNVLTRELYDVEITEKEQALTVPAENWQRILEEYFTTLRVEGRSESTIKAYKPTLVKFFLFVGRPLPEIRARDIRYFLLSYEDRGSSKAYIDNVRRVISAFFSWAHDEGYIRKNPSRKVKKIRAPEIIRKPLTGAEREALNDVCTNVRDQALLATLYSTACRVGELISIDRSDVDFTTRTIKVYGSKGKAERIVCINDTCYFYLKKYLNSRVDDDPALFVTNNCQHRRISKESVQAILRHLGERAGVPNVHPHRFRRSMLTDMSNVSIPIQNIMRYAGHKDVNTTMTYIAASEKVVNADFEHYMLNT